MLQLYNKEKTNCNIIIEQFLNDNQRLVEESGTRGKNSAFLNLCFCHIYKRILRRMLGLNISVWNDEDQPISLIIYKARPVQLRALSM